MSLQDDLQGLFQNLSQTYGIPVDYFNTVAARESSWNPNSITGSFQGLFQLGPAVRSDYNVSDAFDPTQAATAFAQLTSTNVYMFQRTFGRAPSEAEMYLMHQQGTQGAINLLSNPDASAADIVGASAVTSNGGNVLMTAANFAQHVMNYFTGSGDNTQVSLSPQSTAQAGQAYSQVTSDVQSAYGTVATGISGVLERGVIIVLGFIFVAVGLSMFRQGIVSLPTPKVG